MHPQVELQVRLLPNFPEGFRLPYYEHEGDSGFDLVAAHDAAIPPGSHALVSTGIAVNLWPGWELQIRSRSGLAVKHGIYVLNAPGTIDQGYRGEIKVPLAREASYSDLFLVKTGDRIAQAVLAPVATASFTFLKRPFHEDTSRGEDGFGSTGV